MAIETLEQRLGVNPFGKEIEIEKLPETIEKVNILEDETINNLFSQYEKMNNNLNNRILQKPQLETLTPAKIDLLLQRIIYKAKPKKLESKDTGIFITHLIKKSYQAGYNGFSLTTGDCHINQLASGLWANENSPIKIKINGHAGSGLGENSRYCRIKVEGDVLYRCGYQSNFSAYGIYGKAGKEMGAKSKNCYYLLKGEVDLFLAKSSEESTYVLESNFNTFNWSFVELDFSSGARMCKFKTHDPKIYRKMLTCGPVSCGNKIQLIDNAGEIIEERINNVIYKRK